MNIKKFNEMNQNIEILTIRKLKELIESGETEKIKMKTKTIAFHDNYRTHTNDTKLANNRLIKNGGFEIIPSQNGGYILQWHTEEGDPRISLRNEDEKINFIEELCESEYQYLLYI
jgi:hypothetical protein